MSTDDDELLIPSFDTSPTTYVRIFLDDDGDICFQDDAHDYSIALFPTEWDLIVAFIARKRAQKNGSEP